VPQDLVHTILSNTWSGVLIVLFFGGSIFVHELGHFLAARARGVHVEVFSIGFGPSIFAWKAASGTRYQVAWFPLGGYVLLPQIADLGPLERESMVATADLPPVSYATKMIVFVTGATFNVLFAFLLACIVWRVGVPEGNDANSTQIGYVARTIDLPDGTKAPSPALEAGLRVGDVVRAIDGRPLADWAELNEALVMGSGHDRQGNRSTVFTIDRAGKTMDITVHPLLSGDDKIRRVGIRQGYEMYVHSIEAGSAAAKSGLVVGDRIMALNGSPIMDGSGLEEELAISPAAPAHLDVLRNGKHLGLTVPAGAGGHTFGVIDYAAGFHMTYPSPFEQIAQPFMSVVRTVWALINPSSDIGLSKVSGPIGIVHIFHSAAEAGLIYLIRFTIFINVNLAVINLLPIPVLDGGQMLFATIGRLRGRPLPVNFIVTTQSVFTILIVSLVLYVSIFDVKRWKRDSDDSRPQVTAPAAPAAAKP
jgi:regulator of sigma E protease